MRFLRKKLLKYHINFTYLCYNRSTYYYKIYNIKIKNIISSIQLL